MYKKSALSEIMISDLPKITYQKRLSYRTNVDEVQFLFHLINNEVFDGVLRTPQFIVRSRCRKFWGECHGEPVDINPEKSRCSITMSDKWYCRQWLVAMLAHEMCHQYQWDIVSAERERQGKESIMSHGPTFFIFRDRLAEHGIPLKSFFRSKPWFKYQNLFKC